MREPKTIEDRNQLVGQEVKFTYKSCCKTVYGKICKRLSGKTGTIDRVYAECIELKFNNDEIVMAGYKDVRIIQPNIRNEKRNNQLIIFTTNDE